MDDLAKEFASLLLSGRGGLIPTATEQKNAKKARDMGAEAKDALLVGAALAAPEIPEEMLALFTE